MPAEITGKGANPGSITVPIDGEPRNGAGLAVMAQDIADLIRAGRAAGARNWASGPDVAAVFSAGVMRNTRGALGSTGASPEVAGRWYVVGGPQGDGGFLARVTIDTPTGSIALLHAANPKDFGLNTIVNDPTGNGGLGRWIAAGLADGTDPYIINTPDFFSSAWTERAVTAPKNEDIWSLGTDGAGVVVGAGTHDGVDL